jgi:indole-3-glycerol phosphate synthase
VTGSRRFSQAISEGDGISVIVEVDDLDGARSAEAQGAEAIALRGPVAGIRESTGLPILWRAEGPPRAASEAGADACVLVFERLDEDGSRLEEEHAEALAIGLDCVVEVGDDEELEVALERIDPEIFLLASRDEADDAAELDHVLDLLPDVPAGKLAVAEVPVATHDDVVALERAGVDAVIVHAGNVAELVGGPPPEV